jgi:hypothetical protein
MKEAAFISAYNMLRHGYLDDVTFLPVPQFDSVRGTGANLHRRGEFVSAGSMQEQQQVHPRSQKTYIQPIGRDCCTGDGFRLAA